EKVVDLGSGDGRVVIAFARKGIEAHGYEINPILVWLSRKNIKKAGLKKKAFIHTKNFWTNNFSKFDIVVIYGISHIMRMLERKLQKELKPGSRVICCIFPFRKWQCAKKDEGVYLYVKK
ncbi:class I SAM-dependent methyltransferase, partial [Candidatus Peregrinibacteria bacterium]|nr:class I SAM-dependent methyltransferase [Candidatus Peregrinibacteria bacterium]